MTSRLFLVEQNAVSLGGHYYAYTRSLAGAAVEAGLQVTVLQNRALNEGWGTDVRSIPAFSKSRFDSDAIEIRPWRRGNLAFDLIEAIRDEPSSVGDRILFPTLDFGELLQLLHFWTNDPSTLERRIAHLLLRYDPGVLRANLELFRPYFDRIHRSELLRSNLLFHTDTDALSRELRALSGLAVTTLPVTFDQAPLRQRLGREPESAASGLTAIYLGDARREKNYQVLPKAVAHLWADYVRPGRLRFVVQSNFNVPGGEPGILEAAQRLGQYVPDRVRVLSHPLGLDAYHDELAAADIVLLPYDADRYRLRSSGILVEAMAAGKPVVTTAGSWMAGEVDPSHAVVIDDPARLGPAIGDVVDDYARFSAAARALAPDALERSSGRAFIRALLNQGSPRTALGARVVLVADAQDVAGRHAAGDITCARAKALAALGFRPLVVLVEPGQGPTPDDVMARARRRLADIGVGAVAARPRPEDHDPETGGTLAERARVYGRLDLASDDAWVLRAEATKAVWLSRALHFELARKLGLSDGLVIGALDDLDSVRIAIDMGRAVSSDDVATETDILHACTHLVAASSELAEDWRRLLPDGSVIVAPLVLDAKPSTAALLAGARDLADVALRAGLTLEPDDGHAGGRISRAKLAALTGLDMVIVVGDDPPSRDGASWFVREVYRPYLARSGFTLLLVNATRHLTESAMEGLLLAGSCESAGPLYAAARLAIVPATDLARSTPQLWDAISYNVPVVASTSALRGAPPFLDGVLTADDALDLSGHIYALLTSEEMRRETIARLRATLARSSAGRAKGLELLRHFLGEGGPIAPTRAEDHRVPDDEPLIIEWGSPIASINQLADDWLSGRPLDEDTLRSLRGYERAEIANVLRIVVGSSSGSGPEASRSSEQRGDEVILAALSALDPDGGPASDSATSTTTFYSGLPLHIDLISGEQPMAATAPPPGFAPDPDLDGHGACSWLSRADRDQDARVTAVSLQVGDHRGAVTVLSQRIVIPTVERRMLGRRLVEADWALDRDSPALVVREGEAITLNWPAILTSEPSEAWFELRTDEMAELGIRQDGRNLPVVEGRAGGLKAHRVRVEMPASGTVALQVSCAAADAALFEARMCVVLGACAPLSVAEVIDAVPEPPMEDGSGRIALTVGTMQVRARRAFVQVVQASLTGRPVRGSVLRTMRGRVRDMVQRGDTPIAALRSVVSGLDLGPGGRTERAMQATLSALVPGEMTRPDPFSYVASPGLTAEIRARFADEQEADSVTCRHSEAPVEALPYAGTERRWRVPGRNPARGASWVQGISFETMSGVPHMPGAVFLSFPLTAALDPETGDAYIDRLGFHAAEYDRGRPTHVWTGPRPTSRIVLPVAPARAGRIVISMINTGLNRSAGDFAVFLNDRRLPSRWSPDQIVAHFEADPDDAALMEIRLTVAHVSIQLPDPRELGVAVRSIEVEFAMSPTQTAA